MFTFASWLEDTLNLQRNSFDTDPRILAGPRRAEYLRWNVLAAIIELGEFIDEIQWKPWASNPGRINDRDAAVEELVDVMHFIANCLVTLSVTGEELSVVYEEKMNVNADRQERGDYAG